VVAPVGAKVAQRAAVQGLVELVDLVGEEEQVELVEEPVGVAVVAQVVAVAAEEEAKKDASKYPPTTTSSSATSTKLKASKIDYPSRLFLDQMLMKKQLLK